MHECTFCAKPYDEARGGFTIFSRDGTAKHFCSRKCLRHVIMKRKARKLKWTDKKK
jgi:ribosomal protein L24E